MATHLATNRAQKGECFAGSLPLRPSHMGPIVLCALSQSFLCCGILNMPSRQVGKLTCCAPHGQSNTSLNCQLCFKFNMFFILQFNIATQLPTTVNNVFSPWEFPMVPESPESPMAPRGSTPSAAWLRWTWALRLDLQMGIAHTDMYK